MPPTPCAGAAIDTFTEASSVRVGRLTPYQAPELVHRWATKRAEKVGGEAAAAVVAEWGADPPPIGFTADVWSLGCVLFELLYGEPLFQGPEMEVAADICSARSVVLPGVSRADDVVSDAGIAVLAVRSLLRSGQTVAPMPLRDCRATFYCTFLAGRAVSLVTSSSRCISSQLVRGSSKIESIPKPDLTFLPLLVPHVASRQRSQGCHRNALPQTRSQSW